jgi:predicted DsbA family dithiol-disulfide isomerase
VTEPLLVFTDYACPWCYLGLARLRRAAAGLPLGVRFVAFPLSPDTPPEGREIGPYLRSRGVDIDQAHARLAALLQEEGLPFSLDPSKRAYPTRRAQELAAWGETTAPRIHDVLFRAVHVDHANVHDPEVLAGLAAVVGLDPDEARAVLAEGRMAARVDQDWTIARQVGVRSVPTFVLGRRGMAGAQSVDDLRRFLTAPPA